MENLLKGRRGFLQHGPAGLFQRLPKSRRPKVVVAGSAHEYGFPLALPLHETASPHPASPYGWSKLIQTQTALAYAGLGVEVVVARVFKRGVRGARAVAGKGLQVAREGRKVEPPAPRVEPRAPAMTPEDLFKDLPPLQKKDESPAAPPEAPGGMVPAAEKPDGDQHAGSGI